MLFCAISIIDKICLVRDWELNINMMIIIMIIIKKGVLKYYIHNTSSEYIKSIIKYEFNLELGSHVIISTINNRLYLFVCSQNKRYQNQISIWSEMFTMHYVRKQNGLYYISRYFVFGVHSTHKYIYIHTYIEIYIYMNW